CDTDHARGGPRRHAGVRRHARVRRDTLGSHIAIDPQPDALALNRERQVDPLAQPVQQGRTREAPPGTVVVGVLAYVRAGVAVRVDAQRPGTAAGVVPLADDGGPARRLDGWRQSPDPDPGGPRRRAADRVPASYPGVRARVHIVTGRGRVPPAVEPDL